MYRLLASLLLLFCFGFAPAQSETSIPSLLGRINHSQQDTSTVRQLQVLAEHFLEVNLDSSRLFSLRGLSMAQSLNLSPGVIQHKNIIGNYYQRIGQSDSARIMYEQVLSLSQQNGDIKGKAIALNNIAILHTYAGEYPEAIALYIEALEAEEVIGDKKGIAEALNNIGVVHYYMGDIENTLDYFEQSILYSEQIGDTAVIKKGYNNLGALYDYQKDFDKALEYYEKSYALAKGLGQKKEMGIMLNNIATAYSGMQDYENSIQTYRETLKLRHEMQDKPGEANTLLNLGADLYTIGKREEADEAWKEAIAIAEEKKLGHLKVELYKRLITYRKDAGRWEEALEFSEKHRILRDSLLNEERVQAVAEMKTKYETEQKEKELVLEKAKSAQLDKEKAEAEVQVTKRNGLLLAAVASIIGLIFLGLFITQRNRRKAEQEKNRAVITERDRGLKAVIHAQEEERSRISKDLHDGVGQQLSGLKLGIQLLKRELKDRPLQVKHVEKLDAILAESAQDVRSISHQMMPKALGQAGLIPSLEDMLKKSLGTGGLVYQFEELNPVGRLAPEIELGLYRIAQEAVNNIIKHAKASRVEVQIYRQKSQLILHIEDDGQGFDQNKEHEGHGMANIAQRARLIEAQVEIDSEAGKGCRLSLRVPLEG